MSLTHWGRPKETILPDGAHQHRDAVLGHGDVVLSPNINTNDLDSSDER